MKIPQNLIDEIISKSSIVDIASRYTSLKQKGNKYWGCCPFHGEKTPSFTVSEEKNQFYCFGCKEGGGIITFVEKIEKLNYVESIKFLANIAGITIQEENFNNEFDRKKDAYFSLYDFINNDFKRQLKEANENSLIIKYLNARGLTQDIINTFQLGFSNPDKFYLWKLLTKKGYSEKFLKEAGLFSQNYEKMPLFFNRLMFPIFNSSKRVVAFGARGLEEKVVPKYINTGETEYYKKRDNFYSSPNAFNMIRKSGEVYIVEGYMDVIAMYKAGIENCVASLGTAFTTEHALNISKVCKKVNLLFDTDTAGTIAAEKAISLLVKNSVDTYVIQDLNGFKDPDEALKNLGKEKFHELMKKGINSLEFLIKNNIKKIGNIDLLENKSKLSKEIFDYIKLLDSKIKVDSALNTLSEYLNVSQDAVKQDYYNNNEEIKTAPKIVEPIFKNYISTIEDYFFTMLTINFSFYKDFRVYIDYNDIESNISKQLYIALENCFRNDNLTFDNILKQINDFSLTLFLEEKKELKEFILNISSNDEKIRSESILFKIKTDLNVIYKNKKIKEIQIEIDKEKDSQKLSHLIHEKMLLEKEIKDLKKFK